MKGLDSIHGVTVSNSDVTVFKTATAAILEVFHAAAVQRHQLNTCL